MLHDTWMLCCDVFYSMIILGLQRAAAVPVAQLPSWFSNELMEPMLFLTVTGSYHDTMLCLVVKISISYTRMVVAKVLTYGHGDEVQKYYYVFQFVRSFKSTR